MEAFCWHQTARRSCGRGSTGCPPGLLTSTRRPQSAGTDRHGAIRCCAAILPRIRFAHAAALPSHLENRHCADRSNALAYSEQEKHSKNVLERIRGQHDTIVRQPTCSSTLKVGLAGGAAGLPIIGCSGAYIARAQARAMNARAARLGRGCSPACALRCRHVHGRHCRHP
jgi:hypothetical protein